MEILFWRTMFCLLFAVQVASYGPTWIAFSMLSTSHFWGSDVILTTNLPSSCADSTLLLVNFFNGEGRLCWAMFQYSHFSALTVVGLWLFASI